MPAQSRYRLTRSIASGSTAEVFEAVRRSASGEEERVAIKRAKHVLDEGGRASFVDEVRLLSQLEHENIIPLLDHGLADDRPFLVLELVDGTTARALLQERGALPLAPTLSIGVQVARALDHAHARRDAQGAPLGIVHRDINPSNILVRRDGQVKLADFGIAFAHAREARTRLGTAKGTLDYMAPEQLLGGAVGPAADIFALGVVIHELSTSSLSARRNRPARRGRGPPSLVRGAP